MRNYNKIQEILHYFFLGNRFINKSLFEIEKIIYLKKKDINSEPHVFITGLPRSGTTSILNFIYSSKMYGSLIYRNMPFILSPNISKLINKKNISKKDRLHEDGITYDLNSPEAFDEIFFDNNEIFIKNELSNYIQLILNSEHKKRYLSKNNLNYKRIDLIKSILPNSHFLIPIREPLQHSLSLLNQHLLFVKLQKKDNFIKKYMNYLNHHEFGIDHKPWNKPINYKDLNIINYWLEQWCLFYENIFNKYHSNKNCIFLIYDKLIDQDYIKLLLKKINLYDFDNLKLDYFKISNKHEVNNNLNNYNYERAKKIYRKYLNAD
tara:strand:- start:348 stop:1310 length:963 start_codon:yes stop_codon:yes gene_type:complete